jgi:hypothetical protein
VPLADLQRALGALVAAAAAQRPGERITCAMPDDFDLTGDERAWLRRVSASSGFKVTCDIQRWWRETKLRWTARLTLSALGPGEQSAVIAEYLAVVPCASLFFAVEAGGFLDHVARARAERPHLAAIARFERALLRAQEAEIVPAVPGLAKGDVALADSIRVHPAASMVEFDASPERLLGALLARQPLPAVESAHHPILVAPGLARLWRPATSDEAIVFAACLGTPTVASVLAAGPRFEAAMVELLRIGALCGTATATAA